MSFNRMIERIAELQNPTVAGLDPKLSYIPQEIRDDAYRKYGKTLEGAAQALLCLLYTSELRAVLGGDVALDAPEVVEWIKGYLAEQTKMIKEEI